jgi:hypothetical protein
VPNHPGSSSFAKLCAQGRGGGRPFSGSTVPPAMARNPPYCYGVPRAKPSGTKFPLTTYAPRDAGEADLFQVVPYPPPRHGIRRIATGCLAPSLPGLNFLAGLCVRGRRGGRPFSGSIVPPAMARKPPYCYGVHRAEPPDLPSGYPGRNPPYFYGVRRAGPQG